MNTTIHTKPNERLRFEVVSLIEEDKTNLEIEKILQPRYTGRMNLLSVIRVYRREYNEAVN